MDPTSTPAQVRQCIKDHIGQGPPVVIKGTQKIYLVVCIMACKGSQSRTLVSHSHTITTSGGGNVSGILNHIPGF